jgi:hypothetical protein
MRLCCGMRAPTTFEKLSTFGSGRAQLPCAQSAVAPEREAQRTGRAIAHLLRGGFQWHAVAKEQRCPVEAAKPQVGLRSQTCELEQSCMKALGAQKKELSHARSVPRFMQGMIKRGIKLSQIDATSRQNPGGPKHLRDL